MAWMISSSSISNISPRGKGRGHIGEIVSAAELGVDDLFLVFHLESRSFLMRSEAERIFFLLAKRQSLNSLGPPHLFAVVGADQRFFPMGSQVVVEFALSLDRHSGPPKPSRWARPKLVMYPMSG